MKQNRNVQNPPPGAAVQILCTRDEQTQGRFPGFDDIINSWSYMGLLALITPNCWILLESLEHNNTRA